MASRDKSKNLGYLARPCQYVKNPTEKGCDAAYWQDKRYTPEVMMSYQAALNDIAARYDLTAFTLLDTVVEPTLPLSLPPHAMTFSPYAPLPVILAQIIA